MKQKKLVVLENINKNFMIGFKKNKTIMQKVISVISGKEPKHKITALKNVSVCFNSGEIVGIIGKNGCGKSTLLRIIAGIYPKTSGEIFVSGKIVSLINLFIGLKERLSLRDNVYLCGAFFGLSRFEINKMFDSIIKFAELEEFIDTKIYQFSEGMKQRLVFSIAVHSNPEILLLDEVFAVGDEDFRKKSAKKIKELAKQGVSVIFVSHELWMIEKYSDRVIWMERGQIINQGETKKILKEYKEFSLK